MILIITKILLLSWVISSFRPLHDVIDLFKGTIKNPILFLVVDLLHEMISCLKCLSLWLGLILTHSIWIACLTSYIGYLYMWVVRPRIESYSLPFDDITFNKK